MEVSPLQKRSHKLLADVLLENYQGFGARRYELAFLFGSFEPDCNPLTYLKGSLHGRKLQGHCYPNSWPYVESRIRRLQQRRRDRWNLWHYYTLGKLTHYLADAFTYPHNDFFPDSMLDHHRYETDLRRYLAGTLARRRRLHREQLSADVTKTLNELHQQYLTAGKSSLNWDVRHIILATSLLMAACAATTAGGGFPTSHAA